MIELFVDNPDDMDAVRLKARRAPSSARPMIMTDWRQRNKTFFDALNVERNVMFIILALIVLVAALNIISGLIMLVKDKSPDIAILRTMGATRGAILRIFLIAGTSRSVSSGTFAGLRARHRWWRATSRTSANFAQRACSIPTCSLPSSTSCRTCLRVIETSRRRRGGRHDDGLLSILATLYPSWRAATLDPVEALRYE